MTITISEFKNNLDKYLELVSIEDILITKNGKVIAQLTQPQIDKIEILNSLVGIAKTNNYITTDDIKDLRLSKK
jgi:antitoxin (DNA-binding transcriptional repressor) of toxin-antitoxin stability system